MCNIRNGRHNQGGRHSLQGGRGERADITFAIKQDKDNTTLHPTYITRHPETNIKILPQEIRINYAEYAQERTRTVPGFDVHT